MTATNHGLAGAAIALSLHNYPLIAIPLAFASHFLLDALPHYSDDIDAPVHSRNFHIILITDMIVAVITTLIIASVWREYWWLVIVCAFAAASPDVMWLYYRYLKPKAKWGPIARFHSAIQWSATTYGIITEMSWFILLFSFLIFSKLA